MEPNSDAKTVASPEKEACLSEILDDVVEYLSSWKKDFQEGLNSDDVIRLQAVLALINAISVSKGVAEIQLLNLTDSESLQKLVNEREALRSAASFQESDNVRLARRNQELAALNSKLLKKQSEVNAVDEFKAALYSAIETLGLGDIKAGTKPAEAGFEEELSLVKKELEFISDWTRQIIAFQDQAEGYREDLELRMLDCEDEDSKKSYQLELESVGEYINGLVSQERTVKARTQKLGEFVSAATLVKAGSVKAFLSLDLPALSQFQPKFSFAKIESESVEQQTAEPAAPVPDSVPEHDGSSAGIAKAYGLKPNQLLIISLYELVADQDHLESGPQFAPSILLNLAERLSMLDGFEFKTAFRAQSNWDSSPADQDAVGLYLNCLGEVAQDVRAYRRNSRKLPWDVSDLFTIPGMQVFKEGVEMLRSKKRNGPKEK